MSSVGAPCVPIPLLTQERLQVIKVERRGKHISWIGVKRFLKEHGADSYSLLLLNSRRKPQRPLLQQVQVEEVNDNVSPSTLNIASYRLRQAIYHIEFSHFDILLSLFAHSKLLIARHTRLATIVRSL